MVCLFKKQRILLLIMAILWPSPQQLFLLQAQDEEVELPADTAPTAEVTPDEESIPIPEAPPTDDQEKSDEEEGTSTSGEEGTAEGGAPEEATDTPTDTEETPEAPPAELSPGVQVSGPDTSAKPLEVSKQENNDEAEKVDEEIEDKEVEGNQEKVEESPAAMTEKPSPVSAKQVNQQKKDDAQKLSEKSKKEKEKNKEEGLRKWITLGEFLDQGLRENFHEKGRQYEQLIVNLKSDSLRDKFWYPQLQMVFRTDNQRVVNLHRGDQKGSSSKTGQGEIGLEFPDYTLFNWGKDYLQYSIEKSLLDRKKENLFEERQNLKHDLMSLYFQLVLYQEIERVYKEYVRHATFIYRLNREKATLNKIPTEEYLQIRSIFIKSQQEYHQAQTNTHELEKQVAFMVGDSVDTLYRPEEEMVYKVLNLNIDQIMEITKKEAPSLKDGRMGLLNAIKKQEWVIKENLPLPKLSLNLGSYVHSFSQGKSYTDYQTNRYGPGGEDIEVRASLNFSWDLLGERGLFNTRQRSVVHYEKIQAEIRYSASKSSTERDIRSLYRKVKELEQQMLLAPALLENAQKKFDLLIDRYVQQKTTFLNLKEALDDLLAGQMNYEKLKWEHLVAKLSLAKTMGVEDFPGENFEKLVQKVK
jgi:outer membrane protein TolC